MINERDLIEAIEECEAGVPSLQLCEKLACLYTVYDHLYGMNINSYSYSAKPLEAEESVELIGKYGSSEFLSVIEGKEAEEVFMKLDELMDILKEITPRLYASIIAKLN